MNTNPENLLKTKDPNEKGRPLNEKYFQDDMSVDNLDVPRSDLVDQQECIRNEDEENNYYSLGGENHNDLEEEKG